MNKLLTLFEQKLVPTMNKLTRNVWINVLKDSLMQTLLMTLLGSILCLLTVPGDLLGWEWCWNFWTPWNWTMGLLSVFIAVLIPLNYLEKKKLRRQRVAAMMTSIACFFIIVNPIVLEDGVLGLAQTALGAGGMLAAMLSGVLASIVLEKFGKFSFFKQDSPMPDFVRAWFDQLLPCAICVIGMWLLVDMAGVNVFHLLQAAFSPIAKVAQTWYGMVILLFIEAFVYSMGISCWVMSPITNPILTMAIVANIEMARNGVTDVALLNLYTQATIYCAYYAFGGIGNTLALNLMSLRSKSNKIKGLSRASIAPSIFNINEPIVFGMIAWNPFLMVPMWLNGIITPLLMWLFTKIIPFAPIPVTDFSGFWCMPFPFVTWLGTQSLNAVILMLGLFVVSWLIYYPFYKVYEKQEIENERIALESK